MPTYDYECEICHYGFEVFQSIKDEPLRNCPKCRGLVRRLIGSGSGIIFKGSGFYATDYRNSGYTKRKKEEEGAGSAPPKNCADCKGACKKE